MQQAAQSPAQSPGKSQTFLGIQALRGIVACVVVLEHARESWITQFGSGVQPTWDNWPVAVDVLFIISGFVMAYTSTGRKQPAPLNFLGKRLLRVVPIYWIVTLIGAAKLVLLRYKPALGGTAAHVMPRLGFILGSLFFIPVRDSPGAPIQPVVGAGWTLDFEMVFYLLFAVALGFRGNLLRFLVPALLLLSVAGYLRPQSWPDATVLINPILLEFLGGVLLAYAIRAGWRLKPVVSAALGILAIVALSTLHPHLDGYTRPLVFGVPALLIVVAIVMLEERIAPLLPLWILRLGDSSYSLYLFHLSVISFLLRVCEKMKIVSFSEWSFLTVALILSVVAGEVLYRTVERPITIALGRWTGLGVPKSALGFTPPEKPTALTLETT